jgi:hypothetical protein
MENLDYDPIKFDHEKAKISILLLIVSLLASCAAGVVERSSGDGHHFDGG